MNATSTQTDAYQSHALVSGNAMFRLIAVLTPFFFIIQFASYRNIAAFSVLLFALGLFLLLTRIRWGILFYVAVSLLSDDVLRTPEIETLTSVHTLNVFGFTIITFWTLALAALGLFYVFIEASQERFHHNKMDLLMRDLGILFLLAGCVGVTNLLEGESARIFISDASYFVNMLAVYLCVRLFLRRERDLNTLVLLILFCLGIRAVVNGFDYFQGIGASAGANIRVGLESSRNLFSLVPLLALALYSYCRSLPLFFKTSLFIFALAGVFSLLSYSSRGNLIMLALSFTLLLVITRRERIRQLIRKRTFKIVVIAAILAIGSLGLMHYSRPGSLNYISWKLRSTFDLDYSQKISSPAIRMLEAQNIFAHLSKNTSLLWGEGLGGWFSDDYIPYSTELYDAATYASEWIWQGTLYRPHSTPLHIFLKMGILGLLVYYVIMFRMFKEGYRVLRSANIMYWRAVAIACTVFLPLLFVKNFNSKLQIFFGLILAIIANIKELQAEKHEA